MSQESHARHAENIAAYVLGALPELERAALEHHLERCEACRGELERLRPAADAIGRAVTPLIPPPRLKRELMRAVEAERHEPAPAKRGRRFFPARPALAWGLASALIAVGGAAGYGVSQLGDDEEARTLAAQVDSSRLPGASARLVVPGGDGPAVLRMRGMPLPGRGRVYELWVLKDGRAHAQSVFSVERDGSASAALRDSLAGARAVLVTREPEGGSAGPSEQPVLRVPL